jgi:hypothetical protein
VRIERDLFSAMRPRSKWDRVVLTGIWQRSRSAPAPQRDPFQASGRSCSDR